MGRELSHERGRCTGFIQMEGNVHALSFPPSLAVTYNADLSAVFPSRFLHIGGDEVALGRWILSKVVRTEVNRAVGAMVLWCSDMNGKCR